MGFVHSRMLIFWNYDLLYITRYWKYSKAIVDIRFKHRIWDSRFSIGYKCYGGELMTCFNNLFTRNKWFT